MFQGKSYRTISRSARDFINRVLVTPPKQRLTLDEMLDHPFLTGEKESSSSESPTSSPSSSSVEPFVPIRLGERGEEDFYRMKKREL